MQPAASPQPSQIDTIAILDPHLWQVDPRLVLAEIKNPGSTDLPGILPFADPESDAWAKMSTDRIGKRSDLNNLHLKMCPALRDGLYRDIVEVTISFGAKWANSALSAGTGLRYSDFAGCSLRVIGISPKDYFKEIDSTARDCGISTEQLELLTKHYIDRNPEFTALYLDLGKILHRALREMGYSNKDITG